LYILMGLLSRLGIRRFLEYLVRKDILYAKVSLGKNYIPFRAYKIRTMNYGADEKRVVIGEDHLVDENGRQVIDDRKLPNRCWMRRWGVDEWPQLYNVLEGEMSFVGLRPREPYYWVQLEQRRIGYMQRALKFKPGLMPPERTQKNTGNLDDFIDRSIEYLSQKERAPIKTDAKYAAKILWAKCVKGVRGE
ncbi:sugar transferase, partial [Candidatus Woesearchaeota archaeon]|nr:sugar transferase [Candidatus Woesearchaeota archaeon]